MNIYVLCPDHDKPSGGVKQLYRHVDVLNRNGFTATILHKRRGFRCTWFPNNTRVAHYAGAIRSIMRDPRSCLVFPEIYGPEIAEYAPGTKKVIFNQSGYLTFLGYSLDPGALDTPYRDPQVLAALVVSEDTRAYLSYAFPQLPITRLRNGVDPAVFAYSAHKRPQIAFMPGKSDEDIAQVINLLKFRGALAGYRLAPIAGQSEAETAAIMRESLIFLNFGVQEGFALPAAEAIACGCTVVGYDGMGGREFIRPPWAHPVPAKDVLAFAQAVERVLALHAREPAALAEQARQAAAHIRAAYSLAHEEQDIVEFWDRLAA
jgi:glycosyltransferase involved in cell wall biosynthesis